MKPKTIKIGKENSTFQYFEALRRNRTKRHHHREFIIEGVRAINGALENDWQINGVIYDSDKELSNWAKNVIEKTDGVTHYQLSNNLLEKISHKEETSELMLLVAMPEETLSRIPVTDDLLLVVLDRIAYPGNIGTIIRSADALGANGVVITGHAADMYDQSSVNASMGSLFALPTVRIESHKELFGWIENIKNQLPSLQLVGTDEKAPERLSSLKLKRPTAFLFGNETKGLSEAYQNACDTFANIPMKGAASSLNIASAASIMLYETERQRNFK